MTTKYVKLRAEDWEFFKSVLYLCHGMMEGIANSSFSPKEGWKLLAQLQATERYYSESEENWLNPGHSNVWHGFIVS